ncbi:class I SAM-dependent methyltransferase [Paractinoplanes atraurantiacus]|uniref:Methyltransferase domain-containing protein n=1 Tax=Paractinoplanes atraurantiacus TaxID=1036182 RepID=A0A285IAU5_9ACTN|nr:class I SAM-dependent methyltransferase [Actinoplanes atraurantiacus]SNY45070.1 Methyltransferase domain-containing protein [Actinoplanes atraurantiacus]
MTDAAEFDALYNAPQHPPWEIGRIQPALTGVLQSDLPGPHVLDLGCGTGDLAIALARRGYDVTGVDVSAVAIDTARAKAGGLPIHFEVQDATALTLPTTYNTLIDCGLLHNLHRRGHADGYLARLPELAAPGATLIVLAIAHEGTQDWGLTEDYLHTAFAAPTWTATTIERTQITADDAGTHLLLPALLLRTTKAS